MLLPYRELMGRITLTRKGADRDADPGGPVRSTARPLVQ
jgi:hypothetical protein